jgi:hypothetical protein
MMSCRPAPDTAAPARNRTAPVTTAASTVTSYTTEVMHVSSSYTIRMPRCCSFVCERCFWCGRRHKALISKGLDGCGLKGLHTRHRHTHTHTHTHSKAEVVNIALHNMHRGYGGHVLLATCSKASSILAGCSRRRHRKCRQPVRQASNMPGHL